MMDIDSAPEPDKPTATASSLRLVQGKLFGEEHASG
jgi:hypothetical protein